MNNKYVKIAIQLVLLVIAIVLAYLLYRGIMTPIEFNKEKDKRYEATIKKLIDIRIAEVAYKDVNGKYTDNWDTLINFVKHGKFPIVKKIGTIPEELIDSLKDFDLAEREALKMGLISRDTVEVPVLDSLFSKDYPIEQIKYVPYTDNAVFDLKAGQVKTASQVVVEVFEASVHNDVLLHGMNKQLLINLNDEKEQLGRFPGLKVGDINQANNNAGNWETL
ncbi:MAG: hypothetical protein Kow0068_09390 [Marinilabiliales bacterium]